MPPPGPLAPISLLTLALPAAFDEAMRAAHYTSTGRVTTVPITQEARKAFLVGVLYNYLAPNPFHATLVADLLALNGLPPMPPPVVPDEPTDPVENAQQLTDEAEAQSK